MTNKEKMLKSALKLFATQGIDKTSTAQITQDVGLSSGALFVHFKTKQKLIDTIYMNIKEEAMKGVKNVCNSENSVENNVKAISKKLIEYYIVHYDKFIFMELVENDPEFSQKGFKEAQNLYSIFFSLIAEWIDQGHLKKLELELLLRVMWNIMVAIIHYSKKNKIKKVPEKYLNVIWEAVKK